MIDAIEFDDTLEQVALGCTPSKMDGTEYMQQLMKNSKFHKSSLWLIVCHQSEIKVLHRLVYVNP